MNTDAHYWVQVIVNRSDQHLGRVFTQSRLISRDCSMYMLGSPSIVFPWPYHSHHHTHTLTPSNLTPPLTSSMMGASHCPTSLGLLSIPSHMSSNIQRGLPDSPLVLQWLQLYAEGIERHWAQFVPIWGQLYNVTVCVCVCVVCALCLSHGGSN